MLDVGCAECRQSPDDGSLVEVLGVCDTIAAARLLAAPKSERHNYLDSWHESGDGSWAGSGDGELRIIDLAKWVS